MFEQRWLKKKGYVSDGIALAMQRTSVLKGVDVNFYTVPSSDKKDKYTDLLLHPLDLFVEK